MSVRHWGSRWRAPCPGTLPALGSLPANEAVDRAVERGHVDPVVCADAERARVVDMEADRVIVAGAGVMRSEAPDFALVEVGVDVAAPQRAELVVSHHDAAGDRA